MSAPGITINYFPPPTLQRFLQSNARVRCAMGPVGSGKSSAACVEHPRRAVETPHSTDGFRHSRFAVIRNTYPELRDTTIRTFREWVPDVRQLGVWHEQSNIFEMKFGDVRCEVLFRALDRPDDVKKLLSLELTGAYINEAKEVPQAIFKMLLGRIGRYPSRRGLSDDARPWSGIWMDTNPPDNDHWIYKLFEEGETPAGFEIFKQPSGLSEDAENLGHWELDGQCVGHFYHRPPKDKRARWKPHLDPRYYIDLAAANAADPEWVKVYVHGQYGFPRDGKPIYPEYNDNLHCVVPELLAVLPRAELGLGQDFGLTPAAVIAQRDPRDGQLQVIDELVSTDMGAVTFAEELGRKLRGSYNGRRVHGFGDPAGEQRAQTDERTPFDIVRAAGIPLIKAPTNDFTLRREAVAQMLRRLTIMGRPALVISQRCKTLRKAFQGGYCYRRLQVSGRDAYADRPNKNEFSHVAEALQYLCVGEGEGRRAVNGGEELTDGVRLTVKRAFGRRARRRR